jgi:hypothetical protein
VIPTILYNYSTLDRRIFIALLPFPSNDLAIVCV